VSTELLSAAVESTRGVLSRVSPDQLGEATPCASWDVRAVIDHLLGAGHFAAETAEAGRGTGPGDRDFASGDFVATYDEMSRRCVAAFSEPGVLERPLTLPFGELPGGLFLGIVTTDQFTHGWDLARATGQSTELDAELAESLLELSREALPDSFRGPDGQAPFGPAQAAPADAGAADRLAAFLGRRV